MELLSIGHVASLHSGILKDAADKKMHIHKISIIVSNKFPLSILNLYFQKNGYGDSHSSISPAKCRRESIVSWFVLKTGVALLLKKVVFWLRMFVPYVAEIAPPTEAWQSSKKTFIKPMKEVPFPLTAPPPLSKSK